MHGSRGRHVARPRAWSHRSRWSLRTSAPGILALSRLRALTTLRLRRCHREVSNHPRAAPPRDLSGLSTIVAKRRQACGLVLSTIWHSLRASQCSNAAWFDAGSVGHRSCEPAGHEAPCVAMLNHAPHIRRWGAGQRGRLQQPVDYVGASRGWKRAGRKPERRGLRWVRLLCTSRVRRGLHGTVRLLPEHRLSAGRR